MTPPAVANGSLTGTPELISGEANAVNIRVADIKIIQNTKKSYTIKTTNIHPLMP